MQKLKSRFHLMVSMGAVMSGMGLYLAPQTPLGAQVPAGRGAERTRAAAASSADHLVNQHAQRMIDQGRPDRFATLKDVIERYNELLKLALTEREKADLIEYLKSL
jgi:uncharacterized protein YmfQ (DUF2313 family)